MTILAGTGTATATATATATNESVASLTETTGSSMEGPSAERATEPNGVANALPCSPVRTVDPVVRALNTVMYGLVVHFGTLWRIPAASTWIGEAENTSTTDISVTRISSWHQHFSLLVAQGLLLHDYWVYLQHSNVLGNPFCQRLDRQYGIALLKQNQHWAIAGTLSAYWCRETLGMFFCLPYLMVVMATEHTTTFSTGMTTMMSIPTTHLILYSLLYHTIKSRGVRQDALMRSSPAPFGIMRVVIDHFHWHSTSETILTVVRLFLQGLDTWIHFRIVQDLLVYCTLHHGNDDVGHMQGMLHGIFVVWVIHAALNQYFCCSTASLMVQAWYSMTSHGHQRRQHAVAAAAAAAELTSKSVSGDNDKETMATVNDDETEAESVSSSDTGSLSIDGDDNAKNQQLGSDGSTSAFLVRQLLRPGRVTNPALIGRQGTATAGVDTAVRLETAVTILAAVFWALGEAPFRILTMAFDASTETTSTISTITPSYWETPNDLTRLATTLPYTWLLWSLLYGIWGFFLRSNAYKTTTSTSRLTHSVIAKARWRSILQVMDLGVLLFLAVNPTPLSTRNLKNSHLIWLMVGTVTWKAFLQAAQVQRPPLIWTSLLVLEFVGKAIVTRNLVVNSHYQVDMAWIGSTIAFLWAAWVVSNPIPTPCEASSTKGQWNIGNTKGSSSSDVADVVFLGHPAELSDCWALWLLPYSLDERWQCPWWTVPLWPLHFLVGWFVCNYRQRLFGDSASFFCCDDLLYKTTRMQTWTAAHFGRHFVTHPKQVQRNIEAAARHAERSGVKVLCLGALNKAESINSGGLGVVQALGPQRKLSVIHGNHLTAAAVVKTTHQCFGDKAKVFLTGASSKVGWAVAQALRDRFGYEVLCHSTDPGRRQYLKERGFRSAATLSEGTAYSNLWIVGKYDRAVAELIPQNATAVVFSVPHPLERRTDVRVVEAGTLHLDLARLDRPRQFSNKLRGHEIFACHAASMVAALRLKRDGLQRIEETGPVDPDTMDSWLVDAKSLGLQIPTVEPVDFTIATPSLMGETRHYPPPVVIIGAGPAGLATAACLIRRNVPVLVLESQVDPNAFGSWENHFTGLEVTSHKKWCNLPGFVMGDKEFPGEQVTAKDYGRYLQLYANRFGLEIRRGVQVQSVEKGNECSPWIVKCNDEKTLVASTVIVATGKHRIPRRNTSDNLVRKLVQEDIPFLHSADLRDDKTWANVVDAANVGRLCLVGFGNSAADLCTAILRQCEEDGKPKIHVAARTVPPIFPRTRGFLRVDTLGSLVRWVPLPFLQEALIRLLWWGIPSSRQCDAAFPAHLKRWSQIHGRVPVIDKYGVVASGLQSGRIVCHGPVQRVLVVLGGADGGEVTKLSFEDSPNGRVSESVPIDLVVLATGYENEGCGIISREDRLNGLYQCGFGNDKLLPLLSIGEEAQKIASDIANSLKDRGTILVKSKND